MKTSLTTGSQKYWYDISKGDKWLIIGTSFISNLRKKWKKGQRPSLLSFLDGFHYEEYGWCAYFDRKLKKTQNIMRMWMI